MRTGILRNDRGSVLLMVIFSACLSLAVLLGAVAAASLYAAQKRLYMLTDAAALAASQSFDLGSVAVANGRLHQRLSSDNVAAASRSFLAQIPDGAGVRLASARAVSPTTAQVTLTTVWHPPVVSILLPRGVLISTTAQAEGVFF